MFCHCQRYPHIYPVTHDFLISFSWFPHTQKVTESFLNFIQSSSHLLQSFQACNYYFSQKDTQYLTELLPWFPLLSLGPPSRRHSVPHPVQVPWNRVFLLGHHPAQKPAVIPYHLEWSPTSEPGPGRGVGVGVYVIHCPYVSSLTWSFSL